VQLTRISWARRSAFACRNRCLISVVIGCQGCQRAPGADVVATVNDKEIMRADLEKYYKASLGETPRNPIPAAGRYPTPQPASRHDRERDPQQKGRKAQPGRQR